jgi:transposase
MSTDVILSPLPAVDPQGLPTEVPPLQDLVRCLAAREAQLTAALAESSQTVSQQQQRLEKLAHELALLKRAVFGSRRERFGDDPDQKLLFDVSADQAAEAPAAELDADESADDRPERKRKGHGRRPLPQFLPRKRIEHALPGEELGCPGCGTAREKISQVVSEQLEYTPASLCVIEHVQVTYACKACQEHVVTAPKPPQPIDKGLPGPGLLAHVITSKYVQHLPLYRQEDTFARHGLLIRRSTLAGWMAGAAACLAPLQFLLVRRVLASQVIGTDDTPVKVLDPELEHARTGRFWAYVGDDRHLYTAYDYTPSRKRDGPQTFLKGPASGCVWRL